MTCACLAMGYYILLAYTSFNWFMRFAIVHISRLNLLKMNLQTAMFELFSLKLKSV